MKKCEICDIIFDNGRKYSNHVRWNHKLIDYKKEHCEFCQNVFRCENIQKHMQKCSKNPNNYKFCQTCNSLLHSIYSKFCSSSCAAKFNNANKHYDLIDRSYITDEWRQKISKKAKENWANGVYCSTNIHSSKNERLIVKYFKEKYAQDEWKSGGNLKLCDGEYLSRDMWSDKLKICFEYDGVWHFKNICNQLDRKQLKDKLLEQWCMTNGYRLIRVDEDAYKDVYQIVNLIYNNEQRILKIGNRYNS